MMLKRIFLGLCGELIEVIIIINGLEIKVFIDIGFIVLIISKKFYLDYF